MAQFEQNAVYLNCCSHIFVEILVKFFKRLHRESQTENFISSLPFPPFLELNSS